MGIFIQIDFDEQQMTPEIGQRLAQLCPVEIYTSDKGRLEVRPDREDECTLCNLCLEAAPAGALRIHKTYSGQTLISSGKA
jgi:NAD-dependent dihydropyrimidine dehydrogenase PreA subunit